MKKIVIFDLEATCTKNNEFSRDEMEIIEIGAVDINGNQFNSFIKPVRNPILTDFCTELTSIKQEDVDSASEFKEVYANFKEFFDGAILLSWGDYDRKQFNKDLAFHGVTDPYIENNHINIKKAFMEHTGLKRAGLQTALSYYGLEFEGTHHRGIDDAINILRVYKKLIEELESPMF